MKQIRQRIVERRTVPASELKRNPRNWRKHPDAQRQAVATMLEAVGWVDDLIVTVDADGSLLLVDGHLRADLADDQPVPIAVTDLTPAEADLVLASLDSLAAMADSDGALLRELIGSLDVDALSAGLDDGALEASLAAILRDNGGIAPRAGLTDPDAVPEPPKTPRTKLGDLWLLGDHRLLCGDSTKADDVARLLDGEKAALFATDPPYAIYGSSTGIGSDISDDKMVRPFFESILRTALDNIAIFAHVYVCCDWRSWPSWWEMAKRVELSPKNLIVWDKGGGGLGSSYANTYELVGFFARLPRQTVMTSGQRSGQRQVHKPNIWRGNKVSGDREHNAQKPVELMEFLLENSSDKGDSVLEPFAGSGTTIIACERLSRRCYAMEIEPRYVDVAVKRWEQYTGRTAELERAPKRRSKVAV